MSSVQRRGVSPWTQPVSKKYVDQIPVKYTAADVAMIDRLGGDKAEGYYCNCDKDREDTEIQWADICYHDETDSLYHRYPGCGLNLRPSFQHLILKYTKEQFFAIERTTPFQVNTSDEYCDWLPE